MITHLWPFDRAVRVSGGVLVFASPALNFHTYPWNLLGLLLALSGLVGFCPLYEGVARLRRFFTSLVPAPERSLRLSRAPLRSAGH
jgi:hypothetical protein